MGNEIPAFPTILDNTQVSAWRTCPTKFWWAHGRGLAPTEESTHLVAGGAFAKGIEVTRQAYWNKGVPFYDALALGGAALLGAYGTHEASHSASSKSPLNMLGALGYYFTQWPIDGEGLRPAKLGDSHAIEYSFAVPVPGTKHPLTGDPIIYCGRFDAIMQWGSLLMGEDDKTTARLGQEWLNRWRFNSQILGYTWGAREHGTRLAGFVVRGVSLLKNGYDSAESGPHMIAEWKLDRFHENLVGDIARMIEDWERQTWSYSMNQACNSYGGCSFLPLCDAQHPEEWLKVNFYERNWNPLASRD